MALRFVASFWLHTRHLRMVLRGARIQKFRMELGSREALRTLRFKLKNSAGTQEGVPSPGATHNCLDPLLKCGETAYERSSAIEALETGVDTHTHTHTCASR